PNAWPSTSPNPESTRPVMFPGNAPVRSSCDPPRPLPRYDASTRTSGSIWFDRYSTVVVAIVERLRDRGIDVRQRDTAGRLVDRIDAHGPQRAVCRIDDQPPQPIFG